MGLTPLPQRGWGLAQPPPYVDMAPTEWLTRRGKGGRAFMPSVYGGQYSTVVICWSLFQAASPLPCVPLRPAFLQTRAASLKLSSKSPKQDLRGSASRSHGGGKSLQLLTTKPASCLTLPLSGYSLLSLGGQVLQRCPRCTLSGWDTCQASWDCSSFPLHHSACARNQLGREKLHWGKSHMATL